MYPLLNGLRVVECAAFIAAPSCSLHLRQFGAEVIRIDPIGGGLDFRRWPVSAEGDSFYWEGLNKGKKSVAIDLSQPAGRALAVDLITAQGEGAGLFVTNFPKGGFLAHDKLSKRREDLITLRVMGWGDGSSALDYTVNAALGIPFMTGSDANGEEPVNHVLPAWDLMTGSYSAFAMLAAERHRLATGKGQEVNVALSDVAIASLGHMGQLAEVLNGGDRPRYGNALFGAFGRDFKTADGQRLMVVAITSKQWTGLIESLQLQGSIAELEARLSVSFTLAEGKRFEHRDVLFPLFEQAIGALDTPGVAARFDANGVCWGLYRTLQSALRDEPRLSLDSALFDTLKHPSGYQYPAPGAAATFEGLARDTVVAAPRLGEHTDEVLGRVLSMSPTQIGALHDAGVVAGEA